MILSFIVASDVDFNWFISKSASYVQWAQLAAGDQGSVGAAVEMNGGKRGIQIRVATS
jgi:hypothetical protein